MLQQPYQTIQCALRNGQPNVTSLWESDLTLKHAVVK